MKMQQQHYDRLKQLIEQVLKDSSHTMQELREWYEKKGQTAQRFRWDLLWAIPQVNRQPWFDEVYQYLNDDHIDTALRKITAA